ncbi:hypothetical protein GCM10020218_018320 [Dactylosporangium vinaceum]
MSTFRGNLTRPHCRHGPPVSGSDECCRWHSCKRGVPDRRCTGWRQSTIGAALPTAPCSARWTDFLVPDCRSGNTTDSSCSTPTSKVIAALHCAYNHAVADGYLTEDENPALKVPARLP